MMDVNSGYIGYSMSRRAAEAYEDGEMPKSKWTKKAMVAAIQSYCDEFDMLFDPDLLKGMHKDEVFERFFHESSWHHTSKFFNETDFYKLDEDAVCGSFRPMNPTEVAERDAVRRQAIEEEKAVREAMRAAEIEQLDRHRAYREEHVELIASRWSPTGAGWLDMSGHNGLASAMGALDIKQTDNVREWYALAFPGDELAVAINPSLTFDDAIAAVPTGDGFYTALGDAADSLLRERIFEELCNRYGYTYDEVYDSWLHESPLPSPAISQQPEKIAVAAGYRFNLVDAREASGIDLKGCGTVVTVDGHDYNVMKGATYEDSRKVDDLLDSHGDKPISAFRKQPQGMSLKQAVLESRAASDRLSAKNGGTDDHDGKDER